MYVHIPLAHFHRTINKVVLLQSNKFPDSLQWWLQINNIPNKKEVGDSRCDYLEPK